MGRAHVRVTTLSVLGSPASIVGSELSRLLGSGPLSWIETFGTFVWYGGVAGDGLRSVGADGELPIQERVLYPAHRHLRAGALGAPAFLYFLMGFQSTSKA